MSKGSKICGLLLLILTAASGLAQTAASSGASAPRRTKSKTQEQILLEQLNQKLQAIDQLAQKYQGLEMEVQDLKGQLQQANSAAASAAAAAAEAQKALADERQEVGHNDQTVASLQTAVSDLKSSSNSLALSVETQKKETQLLQNPEALRFRGITLTPGGFVAGETVWRQRAAGADVNTPFNSIPFDGQTAGVLSEFNASGRQSRITLLAEGKMPKSTLRGYYESDFLSAGTTSNDNQSNSYTLRQRQVWAQAALNSGWTLTAGQMWSLATEDKSGLTNGQEATPLTIDAQYNVGFTWERQYGFRVVKRLGSNLTLGGAVEEAQTLNIGGHNLPTIAYQQAGNGGGLYNPTANYSYNYAPDLIAKVAWDPSFGHFEVFGIGRFYRDRVFPNGPAPPGATQPTTTSALGAFTSKTEGGGAGVNARVHFMDRRLTLGAHVLGGDGVGRYGTTTLPDATAHPDGSLELLAGGSALGTLEYRALRRLDLYAYYGGEYDKRAYYDTGYFVTTSGPTQGEPILAGYGAPNNNLSGCGIEVLPVTSPNGGGDVPGSASNCQADTRNIQEGTFGYWYRFYQGTHGTFQQGIQYSYEVRHTWQGIGNPLTGLGGSPKAIDNMIFTSFRYYMP